MSPAAHMRAILYLVEIGICSIRISHQRSDEASQEFLDDTTLPASVQIIAHVGRKVYQYPHITFQIMELSILALDLDIDPCLIAVNYRIGSQQLALYERKNSYYELSTLLKPVEKRLLRNL